MSAQTHNISVGRHLNYNINLDDSARVTMLTEIENVNESLLVHIIYFSIEEVPGNITDIEVYSPNTKKFFNRRGCSSSETGVSINEWLKECTNNMTPFEYCYCMSKYEYSYEHIFVVCLGIPMKPHDLMELYTSYSIENFVGSTSKEGIKFITIPCKSFDTCRMKIIENQSISCVDDTLHYPRESIDIVPQNKKYDVAINLPHDRYHYSRLISIPLTYPDAMLMMGNAILLSWHFDPNNIRTPLIYISYKIQKDRHLSTLDFLAIIATILGVISVALAIKDYSHKQKQIYTVLLVILIIIIACLWYIFT